MQNTYIQTAYTYPTAPTPTCPALTQQHGGQVLELLHEGVMPRMADPLLLADFLTHAVRQGGPTAMLALHALFLLITRHGLEYPHFFRCLYGLLTPAMFQVGLHPYCSDGIHLDVMRSGGTNVLI